MSSKTLTRPTADDVALHRIAAIIAEPARTRMLLALSDGRALPASVLAKEAGISASTASSHLAHLTQAHLLRVEQHGRFRYFRISGSRVINALESLASLAGDVPQRSLRAGTRAHRLRTARTCYQHLAGKLGVAVMQSLIQHGYVVGHDGHFDIHAAIHDRLSAPGRDLAYTVSPAGLTFLSALGVAPLTPAMTTHLKYCVDWSEQQHHLSGPLGAALLHHCVASGWIQRMQDCRAVDVTSEGWEALAAHFGIARDFSVTAERSPPSENADTTIRKRPL